MLRHNRHLAVGLTTALAGCTPDEDSSTGTCLCPFGTPVVLSYDAETLSALNVQVEVVSPTTLHALCWEYLDWPEMKKCTMWYFAEWTVDETVVMEVTADGYEPYKLTIESRGPDECLDRPLSLDAPMVPLGDSGD
ncbi:MAG: hypothetical protein FJ090_02135 [Deltaproteobacteria bacterium]|nr:hypothetical protein [Deltaproteobacteria bacterium]